MQFFQLIDIHLFFHQIFLIISSSLSPFWTGHKCNRINDQRQSKISAKQPTSDQQQSISDEIIIQKCMKKADEGDIESIKNYAMMLYYGYVIPENLQTCIR